MSIDIDRLKVDAGYWKENGAPDDATHCAVHDPGKTWFKFGEDGSPMMWHMRFSEWREGLCKESRLVDLIPRLAKADELEWDGTGLPPVGCICEGLWLEPPDGGGRDFESVHIKAYFGFQVWFESQSLDEVVCEIRDCEFRPIRTQAQRERDDAIEKALAMDCHPREGMLSRHDFCGALYDAGMLKYPK